jgi:hypothetical protein
MKGNIEASQGNASHPCTSTVLKHLRNVCTFWVWIRDPEEKKIRRKKRERRSKDGLGE